MWPEEKDSLTCETLVFLLRMTFGVKTFWRYSTNAFTSCLVYSILFKNLDQKLQILTFVYYAIDLSTSQNKFPEKLREISKNSSINKRKLKHAPSRRAWLHLISIRNIIISSLLWKPFYQSELESAKRSFWIFKSLATIGWLNCYCYFYKLMQH